MSSSSTEPDREPEAAVSQPRRPPQQARAEPRAVEVACPACGGRERSPYHARMYRIGALPFDLVRCRCGLVYVNPRPDEATLAALYDDPEYYTEGYNLGVETENYFDRREELLALYDRAVGELERETGRSGKPGDLLELGSAGGFFLAAARDRGWRVRGVEISPGAAAYSRRELGLEVFEGELADAPYAEQSFDLVVADNVLEHTTDPGAVLRRLHGLLRPGGHLLVIVPSYVNSIYFRLLQRGASLVPRRFMGPELLRLAKLDQEHERGVARFPYHILEFDRRVVERLIAAAGFERVGTRASVPLPAHLFKVDAPGLRVRLLRGVFRTANTLMGWGWMPGISTRVLARRKA